MIEKKGEAIPVARWSGASPIVLLAGILGATPACAGKLSVLYQPSATIGFGPGGLYQPLPVKGGGVIVITSGNNQGEYGTILLLTPPAHGKGAYNSTLIYAFDDDETGKPAGHLVADKNGNVWGMTNSGNSAPGGTVFELVNNAGNWTYNVVLQMPASFSNGAYDDLAMDRKGNLFGLQQNSQSVVFEVPAKLLAGGSGSVETLYTFTDNRGFPVGLSRDSNGNLYGVEPYGGTSTNCGVSSGGPGCGAVWEVSPPAKKRGSWTGSFIYNFCTSEDQYGDCVDGYYPLGAPAIDANGTLYGTSSSGGAPASQGPGGVFWSIANGSFKVVYTLYRSNPDGSDGPDFGLVGPLGDTLLSKTGEVITYLQIGGYIGTPPNQNYVTGGGLLGVDPVANTDTIISQAFASGAVQSGPEGLDSNLDNSSPTMDNHGNVYGASNDYYSLSGGSNAPVIFKVGN